MVFIHGGGLLVGSINNHDYNGSVLAANGVVMVSMNYRLGAFGFLYGADASAPGNAGLYDQVLALQWVSKLSPQLSAQFNLCLQHQVRDNIASFGGDKNRVTVFGQSAGSVSGSMLILSPMTRGLFNRVIMQSGAHLSGRKRIPYSANDALIVSKQLAHKVNCTDDKQWLTCLRKVSAKDIIDNYIVSTGIQQAIDRTEFLPFTANEAFERKEFSKG